jgi:hypothetical protein
MAIAAVVVISIVVVSPWFRSSICAWGGALSPTLAANCSASSAGFPPLTRIAGTAMIRSPLSRPDVHWMPG